MLRVLLVDDDELHALNFKAFFTADHMDYDYALTAMAAAQKLRVRRYDLVILDLSMDVNKPSDRSNAGIQQFLSTRPEGTRYAVLSQTVTIPEAAAAAFRLGAEEVFEKGTQSASAIVARCKELASAHQTEALSALLERDRHALLGNQINQDLIIRHLKCGSVPLDQALSSLLRASSPVCALSGETSALRIIDDVAMSIVWSRQLGHAVVFAVATEAKSPADVLEALRVGFGNDRMSTGELIDQRKKASLHTYLWKLTTSDDSDFELPIIAVPLR